MKKVLDVGGGTKAYGLPSQYAGFQHVLLDVDLRGCPDIVCDARLLTTSTAEQFEAVYCSHNLEHYYRHDVPKVLAGFLHVLKPGGFAHIRVPDINELMRVAVERGLDVEDVLYHSPAGPIMVIDVIYGLGREIESSGQDFYAHKTGFTQKSLHRILREAGFAEVWCSSGNLEVNALAYKGTPDDATRALFGIPSVKA